MHRSESLIMPAIPLRSVQNPLRSPCDPPANHPSIRLQSVAITLHVCPLIPRADRSPALGRWARRFGGPKKGREAGRGKGPRCRHACRNAEIGDDRGCIIRSPGRGYDRYVGCVLGGHALRRQTSGQALPMRFPSSKDTSRFVGKALIALLNRSRHPICPNHVASVRPSACQISMACPEKTEPGWGWHRNWRGCRELTFLHAGAAASEKIGGPLSENLVEHCLT